MFFGGPMVAAYLLTLAVFMVIPGGLEMLLDLAEGLGLVAIRGAKAISRGLRMTFWVLTGFFVVGNLALLTAVLAHWTSAVVVFGVILAFVTFTLFHLVNTITVVTRRRPPVTLANLTLLPMVIAITALFKPMWFYGGFMLLLAGCMLVAIAFQIISALNRSKKFYAPYVMLAWMVFVLFAFYFPEPVRAMGALVDLGGSKLGRATVSTELASKPENHITAAKLYKWKVKFDDDGKAHASRMLGVDGNQLFLERGAAFKTIRPPADTVDIGQRVVQIYEKDPLTQEYVFVDDKTKEEDRPWIAAEGTDVGNEPSSEVSGRAKQTPLNPQPKLGDWKTLKSGSIPVTKAFTCIGTYSGKVQIQMSGKAQLDPTRENFGPSGWVAGGPAPNFFTLPGATMMSAIAKVNGKIIYVGDSLQLDLPTATQIDIGPNEDLGRKDGLGLKDNRGAWDYVISSSK